MPHVPVRWLPEGVRVEVKQHADRFENQAPRAGLAVYAAALDDPDPLMCARMPRIC